MLLSYTMHLITLGAGGDKNTGGFLSPDGQASHLGGVAAYSYSLHAIDTRVN